MKQAGISAVVAEFFARIFYRNAINIGLPVLETFSVHAIEDGDELEIRLAEGIIRNLTRSSEYKCSVLPRYILKLLETGGLVRYLEKKTSI